jgi:hypothetical protein
MTTGFVGSRGEFGGCRGVATPRNGLVFSIGMFSMVRTVDSFIHQALVVPVRAQTWYGRKTSCKYGASTIAPDSTTATHNVATLREIALTQYMPHFVQNGVHKVVAVVVTAAAAFLLIATAAGLQKVNVGRVEFHFSHHGGAVALPIVRGTGQSDNVLVSIDGLVQCTNVQVVNPVWNGTLRIRHGKYSATERIHVVEVARNDGFPPSLGLGKNGLVRQWNGIHQLQLNRVRHRRTIGGS